jgi:hypothetical protein
VTAPRERHRLAVREHARIRLGDDVKSFHELRPSVHI